MFRVKFTLSSLQRTFVTSKFRSVRYQSLKKPTFEQYVRKCQPLDFSKVSSDNSLNPQLEEKELKWLTLTNEAIISVDGGVSWIIDKDYPKLNDPVWTSISNTPSLQKCDHSVWSLKWTLEKLREQYETILEK